MEMSTLHLDINNAFLYGDLQEDICMKPPKGLLIQGESTNLVCKLRKSLYGLKQASRQLFFKFTSVLTLFGLTQSKADPSYFYMCTAGTYLGIIVYVDILLACTDPLLLQKFITYLAQHFSFKDLGKPKYF